jgi:hypothetical protein
VNWKDLKEKVFLQCLRFEGECWSSGIQSIWKAERGLAGREFDSTEAGIGLRRLRAEIGRMHPI